MVYNKLNSPKEIARLMEEIYMRHKSGVHQSKNNIYLVELPPPTEEELRQASNGRLRRKPKQFTDEELTNCLENGVKKLGGW